MLPYAHPLVGFLVVGFLLWVGSRGLRSRQRRPDAAAARVAHRRWAPVLLGGVWGLFVFGLGSVAWVRDDLDVAASWHFRVALAVVLLLSTAAALSRRFAASPGARRAHALVGLVTMLGAIVALLLGLGILPD